MNRLTNYFSDLSTGIGNSWNRFWFTPADPLPVAVLRIGTGLLSLYYLFSHSADLVRWFGPHGLLPIETVRQLTTGMETQTVWRLSYLNYTDVPELLWILHGLGFVVILAMTLGLLTRLTTVLSLAVVLSYIHRAPMITGQMEPVLTMLLCYLCIGPAGKRLSLDRLVFGRKSQPVLEASESSWTANLCLRLVQVHLSGFYLMMGLTKLAGDPWWDGTAVWMLLAHADSRIFDLTIIHRFTILVNLLTHAIVFFEICFGVFIWNRLARPLLLLVALPMWLLIAVVSGSVAFCAAMLIANLAFVPASFWRELLARDTSRAEASLPRVAR